VFRTRREELAAPDLGTILSRRDYHVDLAVFVALWPREAAPRWSLKAVAEAMREPQFVPYLGRRACPLMLPLSPEIEVAADRLPHWRRVPSVIVVCNCFHCDRLLIRWSHSTPPTRGCSVCHIAASSCGATHSPIDNAGNSI
jgi:hypothetical protein